MIAFLLCSILLVVGYLTYARLVERIFGPDAGRPTPAMACPDGVDTMPMPTWKVFLTQLLDIAGVGPIFGPILGVLYGPWALVWIVVGTIFAGGVHDYFSGMLSVRSGGASLPEVVGGVLGVGARRMARLFSLVLLILVGVVFVSSPASMLGSLTGIRTEVLVLIIFLYYFLATILPIDKIIGRFYPLFGVMLLFMTVGVLVGMFVHDFAVQSSGGWLVIGVPPPPWRHPDGLSIWPALFITLSCGAISGFHSTQSPIMARCLVSERHGRRVFYGAMVVEGFIAMVWALAAMNFYHSSIALDSVVKAGTPALVVNEISLGLLGTAGGALAIIGVVILPITSGDTAFRASRLILAEFLPFDQKRTINRLAIAVPLFIVAWIISLTDFSVIWRYFGWSNQALAALTLWTAAVYLAKAGKTHWIATLPAAFMTAVVVAFILQSDIGFGLSPLLGVVAGTASGLAGIAALLFAGAPKPKAGTMPTGS